MNNATLINRIIAKWFSKKPEKRYTATIDVSDMVLGKTSGTYKESQKNKPSPSSHLKYNEWLGVLSPGAMKLRKLTRSYVGWTNSMEPTFDYGDMVLKVNYIYFKKIIGYLPLNSIAIYLRGDMRIIHRYIGKDSFGRFIFKGDNNFRADPPVKEEDIQDVMVAILHTRNKLIEGQD